MKQMIKNWKEIESLDGNVVYDKATDKINIKKELNLTSGLTAKTLEQTQANYELDLHEAIIAGGDYDTYFKSDTFYTAFKVINGVLWFILSGSATTKASNAYNKGLRIEIPDDFKEKFYSKIYRSDGTNLSQAPSANTLSQNVSANMGVKNLSNSYYHQIAVLECYTANGNMSISMYDAGTYTDDGYIWLDIRIPIMLI